MAWIIRQFECEECAWTGEELFKVGDEEEVLPCAECGTVLNPVPAAAALDRSTLASWSK